MELKIQVVTLVYSYLYGGIFTLLLYVNYKMVMESKWFFKVVIDLVFVMINVFIYFMVLKKINNGIFHPYYLVMMGLGYISVNKVVGIAKRNK